MRDKLEIDRLARYGFNNCYFILIINHSEAAWIGAHITQKGGSFSWMDGSDWGYANWDPGLIEFNI